MIRERNRNDDEIYHLHNNHQEAKPEDIFTHFSQFDRLLLFESIF